MNYDKLTSIVNTLIMKYYPRSSIRLHISISAKYLTFSDEFGSYLENYETDWNLVKETIVGMRKLFPRIPEEIIEAYLIGFVILEPDEITKLFAMLELTT